MKRLFFISVPVLALLAIIVQGQPRQGGGPFPNGSGTGNVTTNGANLFSASNYFGGGLGASSASILGSGAGKISLYDTDQSNFLSLEAPDNVTGNYTNRFPAAAATGLWYGTLANGVITWSQVTIGAVQTPIIQDVNWAHFLGTNFLQMVTTNAGSGSAKPFQIISSIGGIFGMYVDNVSFKLRVGPDDHGLAVDRNGLSDFDREVTATAGLATMNNNKAVPTTISVGASPFSYTNTLTVDGYLVIDGATAFSATWNTTTVQSSLAGGLTLHLQPGEWSTVTYTVAPGMFFK